MKYFLSVLLCILLALICVVRVNAAPPAQDQRHLTIYQIMVASFIHDPAGAPGYTSMWGPDGHTKNGNLKGITASLDHIKSLGANAIWLTPIFDSSKSQIEEKLKATGYFANDFFSIDPHFGTEADFRELVAEAHARGMYVILDGVFGHHGGVTTPSPSGHYIDCTVTTCDRADAGTGNVSFPGSLEYFKEVATYWIDKFEIDGWRLDQAYQAMQGGHNYWLEIRGAVEDLCARRRAAGCQWGTLGYMVGEDWGDEQRINIGVYHDGGLLSAFDFAGKERISGPMQSIAHGGLLNGYDDIALTLSAPTARGYLNDKVIPNLFLTNHDGYRLADHFDPAEGYYFEKLMMRHAILAAYSGPITLYYGDEFGDRSFETDGGQKDNISRTTGHLTTDQPVKQALCDFVAKVMKIRDENPAMWRGVASFETLTGSFGDVFAVTKTDTATGNTVLLLFSDHYDNVPVTALDRQVFITPYRPEIFVIK